MTPSPQTLTRTELACCPVYREALDFADPAQLTGIGHGEIYPIVNGIPILLPDQAERERVSRTDWSNPTAAHNSTDFYNQTQDQEHYYTHYKAGLDATRLELDRWLKERRSEGPTLEIGSGRGVLQGVGEDYAALDYSFTALHQFVDPHYPRFCGTADRLPYRDGTFSFLFTVAALEHVPKADLAFAEIDRVLKPGGVAFLHPAWHCVQYNCDGIPVRPYKDLKLRQKLTKIALPLLKHPLFKAAMTLPGRLARRAIWKLSGGNTVLRFKRLRPDYEHFWISDADAASSIDSHEGCLFFHSRGYEVLHPGPGAMRQLMCRHVGIVVRKPSSP